MLDHSTLSVVRLWARFLPVDFTCDFSYYRGALGAVLAYDITRYQTFEHCDYWLKEMRQYTADHTPVMLVGNKADLRHLRDVSTEEASTYAGI